jgi:hypothetical protein
MLWDDHYNVMIIGQTVTLLLPASSRMQMNSLLYRTYVYIASCDSNTVTAYDEENLIAGNSTPLWVTWLGPSADGAGSNIGTPFGIASTPVLDPDHNRLFVCSRRYFLPSRVSQSHKTPIRQQIVYMMYALNMQDGTILQSAELKDIGDADRDVRFNPFTQDQRGALNLVDGTVYATFAAFRGDDLGDYHGWLVGCDANDLSNQHYLPTTQTVFGGGCWGPGGAAADSSYSLYIATGNAMWPVPPEDIPALNQAREDCFQNLAGRPPAELGDYFQSVLRIHKHQPMEGVPPRPMGPPRLEVVDWFQPARVDRPADLPPDTSANPPYPPYPNVMTLQELDARDLDFGSSSCLLLPDIEGWHLAVVSTKGFVFLLDRDNLGRSGSALQTLHVFADYDASPPDSKGNLSVAESHTAPAYLHANGENLVFFSGGGLWSGLSGVGVNALVCFKVEVIDGRPALSFKWSAKKNLSDRSDLSLTDACASPTIGVSNTNILGQSDFHALVWIADVKANIMEGGRAFIQAYDALTGNLIFDSLARPNDQLSDLPNYAPITCAGSSVYVGTAQGFAMFRGGIVTSKNVRVAF